MNIIVRILDANANRAREGLRTAEEYVRFGVGDESWSGKFRGYRHRITAILNQSVPHAELCGSRQSREDCGNPSLHPERQGGREGELPQETAVRGLKRAQEALRALEEYAKGLGGSASGEFAQVRFELYEAEQWLVRCAQAVQVLRHSRLYVLLSSEACPRGLETTARASLDGGATVLQLREKRIDGAEFQKRAEKVQEICAKYGAAFLVNDRLDIAQAAGAAGVHVGQEDLAPKEIRKLVGRGLVVGRSTHSVEQAQAAADQEEVEYIGIGAMYETATKAAPVIRGPALAKAVSELKLDVPVFAIGGITAERARELKQLGVERVAVASAVTSAPDPKLAAAELVKALQ